MLDGMRAGDCIDGRFDIQERIGAGGMGVVYRAFDRLSGERVAVKLLWDPAPEAIEQLVREARALASLAHPHVVKYVTHGISSEDEPYLVMEWLAGESLSQRLARRDLDIAESIDLVRRVAGALGAAHARGIVHRDIKPSNIFLADCLLENVKVLDFGLAHLADTSRTLMRTGLVAGTAGYMAPEQARGQRARIDPRADVFSLGCVLFECLAGRPAFQGRHRNMLHARVLFEEPPRVSSVNDTVPMELDELVARMLAKEPAERPADGLTVAVALAAIARSARDTMPRQLPTPMALSRAERTLISIVAADVPLDGAAATATATSPAPAEATRALHLAMRRAATRFEARVEALAGGGIVVMLAGAGNAADRAALAARCALEIAAAVPGKPIALVTGWSESGGGLLVGEVLDRAALLLEGAGTGAQQARAVAVCIDDATRALLDARFEVVEQAGLLLLCGAQADTEPVRLLLGKPSPFVGRERELRQLLELAEDGLTEPQSVAILVAAPAGMGKSRLGRELVRAMRSRHGELVVGMGQGDSIGAGSPFAMLAASLRSALGIPSGEPALVQQEALAWAVNQYVGHADRQRVTELLGELLGAPFPDAPFPDEGSPQLRAARRNAQGMATQVEAACIDLLRGLTAVRPVLLVLEDLHWGDASSVRLLDTALRELEDSPLAVLALARPEVHERFPGLWAKRNLHEVRLSRLSRNAAATLVHNALGDTLDADRVAALVQSAGGNTFYLEELVRVAAGNGGGGGPLPETVLGVVAERLASLQPDVRQFLRAGSVFGQRFCTRGALDLLGVGEEAREGWLDVLADLVEREVLVPVPRAQQRFAGEDEHAFRHALIRDAAYAMLAERDRLAGHRRAGEWLLGVGEQDPLVLAEHFAQGGQGTRAAELYRRAAELALLARDLPSASAHAERALGLEPEQETRAALHTLVAALRAFAGDPTGGYQNACRAMELAAPGTATHGRALSFAAFIAIATGQSETMARLSEQRLTLELTAAEEHSLVDAFGALTFALVGAALERGRTDARGYAPAGEHFTSLVENELVQLGAFFEASELLERLHRSEPNLGVTNNWLAYCQALLHMQEGHLDEAIGLLSRVAASTAGQGHAALHARARASLFQALIERGDTEEAERAMLAPGDLHALPLRDHASAFAALARLRLLQGRAEDAQRLAREALEADRAAAIGYRATRATCHLVHAEALHASGDLAAAEQAIREARDDLLADAGRIEDPAFRHTFLSSVPLHARILALAGAWLGETAGSS